MMMKAIYFLLFATTALAGNLRSSNDDQKCNALVLSGGGDRGAYEVGAMAGLIDFLPPDQSKWHVVAGANTGAINTWTLASYEPGDEKAAIDYLRTVWQSLESKDVYEYWPSKDIFFPDLRELLDGLLDKSGIYDTAPLKKTLQRILDLEKLQESSRVMISGATDLASGLFVEFNKTTKHFADPIDALLASQAIPGLFPTQIADNGRAFISGGVKQNVPVLTALTRCHELGFTDVEITVVLSFNKFVVNPTHQSWENSNTVHILFRIIEILLEYFTVQDIQLASQAYPNTKFRVFGPSVSLPGSNFAMDYDPANSKKMIDIGYNDAKNLVAKELAAGGVKSMKEVMEDGDFQRWLGTDQPDTVKEHVAAIKTHLQEIKSGGRNGEQDKGTCHALSLSGGGDRGSYEAGVLSGLVEKLGSRVSWHIVSGTSAGALNTMGLGMYNVGEEKAGTDFLTAQWGSLDKSHVYKPWVSSGWFHDVRDVYEGLFKHSGFFDTSPEVDYLASILDNDKVHNSDRSVFVGATNVDTGLFNVFDKTSNANHAALASSAVPAVFETRTFDGVTYSDGGCKANVPVIQAIRQCLDRGFTDVEVTVVLCDPADAIKSYANSTTIPILERTAGIILEYTNFFDVQTAAEAFPDAKLRVIAPSVHLPGTSSLEFDPTNNKIMIDIGFRDGVSAAEQEIARGGPLTFGEWIARREKGSFKPNGETIIVAEML